MFKPHSGPREAELAYSVLNIQTYGLDIVQSHATALAWKLSHMTCPPVIRFPEFQLASVQ
jgi:hypothetical protein